METPPLSPRSAYVDHPVYVLLSLLTAVLVCSLIGRLLAHALALSMGSSLDAWLAADKASWDEAERFGLRALNLIIHLCTFTLSSVLTIRLFYGPQWLRYFKLDLKPSLPTSAYSILFVLASFPLAQLIYWLNKQLPLPQWMKSTEAAQNSMIEAILQMNNPAELAFTLLTVAIVPALGEELLFRGVVQQQLSRWMKSEHAAIWLSAALFSAVHAQFEGFFPRLLLGAVLGYLFFWTRQLWVPILCHFIFNGLQVVAKFALGNEVISLDSEQVSPPNWLFSLAAALLMFAAGKWLQAAHKNA